MNDPAAGRQLFARGLLALALAQKGFRIFPLIPGQKLPAIKGWPDVATSDAAVIRGWWSERDYNIGIACGRAKGAGETILRLVVLDYDCKKGKNGDKTRLEHLGLRLLDTMAVKTPNGWHYYFLCAVHVPNSVSRIAEHVDVRGHHGYVVGPGSELEGGGKYEYAERRLPVMIPQELLELAVKPGEIELRDNVVRIDFEMTAENKVRANERARAWLVNAAPEAIEGQGGDKQTLANAMFIRDMGVDEDTCFELMSQHWNTEKARPSWELDDDTNKCLRAKVRNAYKSAKYPFGNKNPDVEFEPVVAVTKTISQGPEPEPEPEPEKEQPVPPKRNWHAPLDMSGWDDAAIPEQQWTILNVVPRPCMGIFSGEGGIGKSILELMKNVCHTAGLDWLGMTPVQGPTLYMGTEDGKLVIQRRLMLIARHYGVKFTDLIAKGFHVWPLADASDPILVEMNPKTNRIETTKAYDILKEFCGDVKPVNVSVDTLSQMFAGNENARVEVSGFSRHMRVLSELSNGSITALLHPSQQGTNTGTGTSGSTAWHGIARFRHYLVPVRAKGEDEDVPDNGLRHLRFMKNQYGPRGTTLTLKWNGAGLYLPVAGPTEADQLAREVWVNDLFMDLLVRLAAQGRNVSDSSKAPNYAPKVFARETEAVTQTVQKEEFEEAMVRLFREDKILKKDYGRPSRPNFRIEPKTAAESTVLG
jgi:RecA-family ATPase